MVVWLAAILLGSALVAAGLFVYLPLHRDANEKVAINTPAQADIVTFEMNLTSSQLLFFQLGQGITLLNVDGGNGGPDYLQDTVAPAFFIGINDPLKPGFTNADFNLFAAWEPTRPGYASLSPARQAIGRGEALFNNTTFVIHDVPGLNSAPNSERASRIAAAVNVRGNSPFMSCGPPVLEVMARMRRSASSPSSC